MVQGHARRARWAVAARAVERVPAEEKVVWPVRVAGAEAMRARSLSDGEGCALSAGQASRPSVALVHVLEVEPAHVAPGRGGSVRVVSAWEEDVLIRARGVMPRRSTDTAAGRHGRSRAGPRGGADSLKHGGPTPSWWRPPEREPRAALPERGSARAQRPAAPD